MVVVIAIIGVLLALTAPLVLLLFGVRPENRLHGKPHHGHPNARIL